MNTKTITLSIYPNACEDIYIDRGFFCDFENALIYARKVLKENAPKGLATFLIENEAVSEANGCITMTLAEIENDLKYNFNPSFEI